jgi:asparagine synthase (glutamine-hydrolysing)
LSGIVGVFNTDGAPVEVELLRSMTDFLAYRGPDGRAVWSTGPIGLGHAMLRTLEKALEEHQPLALGSLWITADVHLDSRSDLIKKLKNAGQEVEGPVSDAALILHAYAAWGPECVQCLSGDFSFGIWDAGRGTLFCARDHFGIKPFYYAKIGNVFIFSNTLNCVRQHTAVTKELNESAIGDFLLFGLNYNDATTTFRDIQRLPPAHTLLVSHDKFETRRYWYPPTQQRIRYTRSEDYLERFAELLKAAVADRLPADRVGICLSGGLDSGSMATIAQEFSRDHGGTPEVISYTAGYDSLIPDEERLYARELADHLGIANHYVALDKIELFERWDELDFRFPEPNENPISSGLFEYFQMVSLDCRVALSGEGADNLMYFQMWPYIKELQRNREWSRLATETAWFLWIRPFPWLGIKSRLQTVAGKIKGRNGLPRWIAPQFIKREGLEARWNECTGPGLPDERHASRTRAHASMLLPQWTNLLESQDPGVTHCAVEVRYPFLDLRMVEYLLAVPAFPWTYKKELLRRAMINKMPERLRLRPKTPLSTDPVAVKIGDRGKQWIENRALSQRVCEFVVPSMLGDSCVTIDVERFRPYCLDLWLHGV